MIPHLTSPFLRLAAVLVTGATVSSTWAARPADDWQLLPDESKYNQLRAEVLPAHPAGGGLALMVVDGLWHLVPAKLSASDETYGPGIRLLDATPADAISYLRIPGLVPGKVDAADMRFRNSSHRITHESMSVPFKGSVWRLESRDGKLRLDDGSRQQLLPDPCGGAAGDMCVVFLAWAGDLDRDGKPDFLIEQAANAGGVECLYLSSRAKPDELVGSGICIDLSDQ